MEALIYIPFFSLSNKKIPYRVSWSHFSSLTLPRYPSPPYSPSCSLSLKKKNPKCRNKQNANILLSPVNKKLKEEGNPEEHVWSEFQWIYRDLNVLCLESNSKFSWIISSLAFMSTDILEKYFELWPSLFYCHKKFMKLLSHWNMDFRAT